MFNKETFWDNALICSLSVLEKINTTLLTVYIATAVSWLA